MLQRMAMLVALLATAGCSDGNVTNCSCTVSIGESTATLGCGASGCIAGERFGCDEDNVVSLGACFPDLSTGPDGEACHAPQAVCEPGVSVCCDIEGAAGGTPLADAGGTPFASCDRTTLRCCVPTGALCLHTSDCCADHECVSDVRTGIQRCGI